MRIQKKVILWSVLLSGLLVTGCSETELEERCFPMLVAVGYDDERVTYDLAFPKTATEGDTKAGAEEMNTPQTKKNSFEKSKEAYESRLNKVADYNHLKVIVLEKDFMEESVFFQQMLDYLAKTEELPRNTYVCAVEDIEDLFELEKNLSQDLGTYLEEYINKHEENKSHILTLGDLLDEKENESMILYMPYLEVENNYVEWGGYVNILGDIWKDF